MRTTQETVTLAIGLRMHARRELQRDVGEVLGLSSSAVSKRLNGETRWSVDDLDKLADHYGVSVAQLVSEPAGLADLIGAQGSVNTRERTSGGLESTTYRLAA